jgi:hypothetical protein
MIVVLAVLIVVGVTAVAVTAMLFARSRAPEGSHVEDGDRASGVFGMLATGLAILLGFVVFLAFESYDTSRSGAEDEARALSEQFETAQFLPASVSGTLSGQLVCYGRTVVHQEWPLMRTGELGDTINPWSVALFKTLKSIEPRTASQQTAYDHWFDQVADREAARSDRTHGAEGVIPVALWVVLFLSALVAFGFMLLFADPSEHAIVQGAMAGGVAVVLSSTLLLLWFLDNPYHKGVSGLEPVAMERTLTLMDNAAVAAGVKFTIPCDENGVATRA